MYPQFKVGVPIASGSSCSVAGMTTDALGSLDLISVLTYKESELGVTFFLGMNSDE